MARTQEVRRLVLIADEDDEARAALTRLLEGAGFDVIGATSGTEALTIAKAAGPCLVILEVALTDLSGYEVCRTLREELGNELPVVFVSGMRTESYDRVAGLLVGADDYVVRPYAADELLARVRRLVRQPRAQTSSTLLRLTPRELEVLQLLADGLAPADIAARLFISTKTVGTHVEHIFAKLGVSSRVQAVAIAYRDGLVPVQR